MAVGSGPGARWRDAVSRPLLWCFWGFTTLRMPFHVLGVGPTSAVAGGVVALLLGLRGAAVLLEVHELAASGHAPGRSQVLWAFLTMPPVALASKGESPGLLYRWRGHLRREGGARRDLEHHLGGRVTVTVLYRDPRGEPVPEVPSYCPRSFTVEVEGELICPNRSHPARLGDPTTFWATLVADAAAGDLTVLRRAGDMCVVARVDAPGGARCAILMADSDWDLVRAAEPARPPRTTLPTS